jgi:hypothetical protein
MELVFTFHQPNTTQKCLFFPLVVISAPLWSVGLCRWGRRRCGHKSPHGSCPMNNEENWCVPSFRRSTFLFLSMAVSVERLTKK